MPSGQRWGRALGLKYNEARGEGRNLRIGSPQKETLAPGPTAGRQADGQNLGGDWDEAPSGSGVSWKSPQKRASTAPYPDQQELVHGLVPLKQDH